jgi:hypothetical protein
MAVEIIFFWPGTQTSGTDIFIACLGLRQLPDPQTSAWNGGSRPLSTYRLSVCEFEAASSVNCAEGRQVNSKSTGGDYDV